MRIALILIVEEVLRETLKMRLSLGKEEDAEVCHDPRNNKRASL